MEQNTQGYYPLTVLFTCQSSNFQVVPHSVSIRFGQILFGMIHGSKSQMESLSEVFQFDLIDASKV